MLYVHYNPSVESWAVADAHVIARAVGIIEDARDEDEMYGRDFHASVSTLSVIQWIQVLCSQGEFDPFKVEIKLREYGHNIRLDEYSVMVGDCVNEIVPHFFAERVNEILLKNMLKKWKEANPCQE